MCWIFITLSSLFFVLFISCFLFRLRRPTKIQSNWRQRPKSVRRWYSNKLIISVSTFKRIISNYGFFSLIFDMCIWILLSRWAFRAFTFGLPRRNIWRFQSKQWWHFVTLFAAYGVCHVVDLMYAFFGYNFDLIRHFCGNLCVTPTNTKSISILFGFMFGVIR